MTHPLLISSKMNRRAWLRGSVAVAAATIAAPRSSAAGDAVAGTGEKIMLSDAAVADLAKSLTGDVVVPTSADYDEVRKVWNPAVDHFPALVVRCASVSDIQAAVQFGRAHNILTAVRSGGHGNDGSGMAHGGMTIDIGRLESAEIDVGRKIARLGGGAKLGSLDRASCPHNLGTTAGVVSHTGIGGLATGQGQGRLARMFGYTVDNFLSVEVVLPDGRLVKANDRENSDLFWAVRGGGGNFGIVTQFELRLHEFDPKTITSYSFSYPLANAKDALKLVFAMGPSMPLEMSLSGGLRTAADGSVSVGVSGTYIGPASTAEKILAPLKALGEPTRKRFDQLDYIKLQSAADGTVARGRQPMSAQAVYNRGGFFDTIDAKLVDIFVDYVSKSTVPGADAHFSQLGGAPNKVAPEAAAFCHRDLQYGFTVDVGWRDPKDAAALRKYTHDMWAEIYPMSNGAFYVNQAINRTDEEMVRTFGKAYPRLVDIKTKYDPTNFFRLNPNIKPRTV